MGGNSKAVDIPLRTGKALERREKGSPVSLALAESNGGLSRRRGYAAKEVQQRA